MRYRDVVHGAHHRGRAAGVERGPRGVVVAQVALQRTDDEAVEATGTIVGGDLHRDAEIFEVLDAQQRLGGAGADESAHPPATREQLLGDRIGGTIKGRRGARLVAITNGGAIGDIANYPVVVYPDETPVGSLDEDFAIESNAGDIFLLGNTSWRIRRVEATRVLVDDAKGLPPTIPFWVGEAPARTAELSQQVSQLRVDVEERILQGESEAEIAAWLADEASTPMPLAEQAIAYLCAGRKALGALPTGNRIIAERFFDNAGGMQLVLHSPLGGRINKAWGLALRKKFCRSFNFELQAAATDDGIVISLGPPHSFALESVFRFVNPGAAKTVLEQAVLGAPVFTTRWRWAATRSLTVQRRYGAKKVPPTILRMRTDDLLTTVFPMQQACLENVVGDIELPDHPLVKETMRDCLSEFMDCQGFIELLEGFERGDIEIVCCDTSEPSPLCHELLSANPYAYLDDAPLEERRTRAISLPRGLKSNATGEVGVVSDEAIQTAEEEAHPPVRDQDELHDLLLSLYVVRERPEWSALAEGLIARGRATRLEVSGSLRLVAAERAPIVLAVFENASLSPELPPLPFEIDVPDRDTAALLIARGHLEILGPTTAAALGERLLLDTDTIAIALGHLEAEGTILRGRFSSASRPSETCPGAPEEVCNRRMLARVHRLTLGNLRRQIEPVTAAALMRFLFSWQRVGSETKLIGSDGLHRVIEQLQGFQLAAGAWERDIFPSRLHAYDVSWLDNLCLSGQVSWARLSPRVVAVTGNAAPTKAAPLSVMLREDMPWLRASSDAPPDPESDLSENGRVVHSELAGRGARFLPDLASALKMSPTDVESALWELASAGLGTADGFASLRVLVDRRRGEIRSRFDAGKKKSGATPRGRWRDAIKRSRRRDADRPALHGRSLAAAAGRWSILESPDYEARCPESWARQLLIRYGVVFRDILSRESGLPPWRELLVSLRRLEARGEIRGGRFVSGFVGEQFALPEALDGLRAMRTGPRHPELVELAATDPLNLVGITSSGARCPAVIGNRILYRNGVPLASIEGAKLVVRQTLLAGESISDNLDYRGPRPTSRAQQQAQLPI